MLYDNLKFFIKELGIDTEIYLQSELGFNKKKQSLILEMCQFYDSDLFVFGRDGKNYSDLEYFKENNRKIYFQEYNHPVYSQLYNDFIPNLSIIDLLFNVGSEKAKDYIMKDNISKTDLVRQYINSNEI